MTDQEYMWEAVLEGRKSQSKTGTNPPVGAIIVKDGKIVGRGHTSYLGGPHAKINAQKEAEMRQKEQPSIARWNHAVTGEERGLVASR